MNVYNLQCVQVIFFFFKDVGSMIRICFLIFFQFLSSPILMFSSLYLFIVGNSIESIKVQYCTLQQKGNRYCWQAGFRGRRGLGGCGSDITHLMHHAGIHHRPFHAVTAPLPCNATGRSLSNRRAGKREKRKKKKKKIRRQLIIICKTRYEKKKKKSWDYFDVLFRHVVSSPPFSFVARNTRCAAYFIFLCS